jgi:hypothetical protein
MGVWQGRRQEGVQRSRRREVKRGEERRWRWRWRCRGANIEDTRGRCGGERDEEVQRSRGAEERKSGRVEEWKAGV